MPISMRIAGESWSDLGHGAFGSAGVSRVRWSHEPEVADIAIEPARLRSPSSRAARAFLALVLSVYLTTPASASAGPVEATPTLNWSGYGLAGTAFTGVTGTFNVPNPRHSVGCLEETAVWVGIDGMYNDDLLQAGIAESGFAQPTNRARTEWPTPGVPPILCGVPVQVYGWWEDLPSAPVRVNLPVQPGDSVTVSLFKMSPGWWALALHDLTAKRSFLLAQPYDGPQTSVEWVVEAPGVLGLVRDPVPFGTVDFHDLDAYGDARSLERFTFASGRHFAVPVGVAAGTGQLLHTGFAVQSFDDQSDP